MSDPTIPELVARLRELLSKAHPLPWLYRGKSDSLHVAPPEPPFSYGAGFLRLTEYDDAEATAEDIDLILEAVNALPTLLDALERGTATRAEEPPPSATWRPITQVPTAEEHAWCEARYLFEDKHGNGYLEPMPLSAFGGLHEGSSVYVRYMLIPPSNHSVDANEKVPAAGGSEKK